MVLMQMMSRTSFCALTRAKAVEKRTRDLPTATALELGSTDHDECAPVTGSGNQSAHMSASVRPI